MCNLSDGSLGDDLPSSPSASRNRDPILAQLRKVLKPDARVLEIASGTGEHAVYFANAMPSLAWQPTDLDLDAMGLRARLEREGPGNVAEPFALNIAHWPNLRPKFDAVISINCIHIAPEELLSTYVAGAVGSLKRRGMMILYGPFKYGGAVDTKSNEDFDRFLQETYSGGGIRDFEHVDGLAVEQGMVFEKDIAMPANNRFLVWRKP
jgi:cyclopropane fatty-acyl-phospholipid synthase-like methyltransferase